jgi:penicillin-binding protein 1C
VSEQPIIVPERGRVVAAACALLLVSAGVLALLIPVRRLIDGTPSSTAVYDSRGTLLRLTLAADDRYRLVVPLSEYPEPFIAALLLKEDRLFFEHPGINPATFAKAAWHSLVLRDYRAGGSTITMQLARLASSYDSSTIRGKLRQLFDAFRYELAFSKREILAAYCARVPCGGNIEGFATASLVYFGKPLASLSLSESLILVSLPQKPWAMGAEGYAPSLLESRNRLYRSWLRCHPGEAAEAEFSLPLELRPHLPFLAPHAVDSLVRSHPLARRIDSTLDYRLERDLERIVSGYAVRKRSIGIRNASALLVDTEGMKILAEVGSADFFDETIDGQVNGTEAKRSPGSTLKPFLYALAMDQGLIHPMTVLKDSPIHFSGYNPDNFDNDFEGPVTARDALIRSRNVPAVYLMQKVQRPNLHDFLVSAGVKGLKGRDWYGVSLILGTAEVTSKELALLYGGLANGGRFSGLREASDDPLSPPIEALSPEAAWLALDILKDKPRPEESASVLSGAAFPACAWKTGTSIGFRDAWSVGVFGHYVLVVWVGDFAGVSNNAFVGLSAAAPLMFEILDSMASSGVDCRAGNWARRPESLVKVEVCADSGEIPTALCPRRTATWFIPGKSPIGTCGVHQEVFVDLKSGLRKSAFEPGSTRREVMEVWPSDLMELFARAGLPRRAPPPFAPGEGDSPSSSVDGPEIVSPLAQGQYIAHRAEDGDDEEMPLVANIPSDAERVFWFLDDSFIGTSPRGRAFFWKLEPGSYTLRAVDDRGRASSCHFSVMTGD